VRVTKDRRRNPEILSSRASDFSSSRSVQKGTWASLLHHQTAFVGQWQLRLLHNNADHTGHPHASVTRNRKKSQEIEGSNPSESRFCCFVAGAYKARAATSAQETQRESKSEGGNRNVSPKNSHRPFQTASFNFKKRMPPTRLTEIHEAPSYWRSE